MENKDSFEFITGDETSKLIVDYEENIIEMENLESVFQQLLAVMFGWTN